MPVVTTCTGCGKKIKAGDEMVGKMARCPACKTSFVVQPPGGGATIRARAQAKDQKDKSKLSINWGPILLGVGALLILGFIALVYFGPAAAKREWDKVAGEARSDVIDVVQRGVAFAKLQEVGPFNPALKNPEPQVHDVHLFWKPWVMSMPEYVEFKGTSTEGEFTGRYYTKTAEVRAEAEVGGFALAGVDPVQSGDRKIQIVGTSEPGNLRVTVDGKEADMTAKPRRAPSAEDE